MSLPLVRMASLDLLRGFVAVGRRMSITLAAQDLCLTQSAVSRQVQALEEALGVKLLHRGYRAITFTPEGERLFRVADSAVQQLQDVYGALSKTRERLPVTVTASIGVTALWLLPRLGRFQHQFPNIDLRVATNNKLLDLRTEGVDLAIRYGTASSMPAGAEHLFGESLAPVAHPSLGLQGFDTLDVIAEYVLLEFDDPSRPWLQWAAQLNALGLGAIKPKGILRFNQYDQVIQAAVAGQGVALGRLALVAPMLADKRLVALSAGRPQPSDYAYWLISADTTPREDVQEVANWIKAEARALASHA
ncbi:LysR substrate-binding domain-containing protein [Andreprevotia chitinilytica]|uniref:LysR substrate-binding domain-containing protein n=1 Tax=Andreprevotia chitinilytica TaxID=396808 RepID=UPI0005525D51|nr:LysR substrate-binding domain-containing protein [Andreprevotia chitinilytica]